MMLLIDQPDRARIVRADDPAEVYATIDRRNILEDVVILPVDLGAPRMVTWSGTLAENLNVSTPLNWSAPGREAFDAFCDVAAESLEQAGLTLLIQPHARHVVSDIPSCIALLKRCESGPFGLALSPATMLTAPMMKDVDEFFQRAIEVLGAGSSMILLHDVAVAADRDGVELRPLGRGCLDRERFLRVLEKFVPERVPIAVMNENLDAQRTWLGIDPT